MTLHKTIAFSLFLTAGLIWTACGGPAPAGESVAVAVAEAEIEAVSAETTQAAEWLTDYKQALVLAGEQDKPVLINFTGSDWCPPCMMLHRDVFATAEFNRYAAENVILLEIDFPRGKEQPTELVEQNQALLEKYNVDAFPTLVLLDAKGEEKKRDNYFPGGPRAFIDWIRG